MFFGGLQVLKSTHPNNSLRLVHCFRLQRQEEDEDEWRYYHDPVMRPAKGHLWSTGLEDDESHGQENDWLEALGRGTRIEKPFGGLLRRKYSEAPCGNKKVRKPLKKPSGFG